MTSDRSTLARHTEQLFVAAALERRVGMFDGQRPILYSDLVAYLLGSQGVDLRRVETAVKNELSVRRLLNDARNRLCLAQQKAQAVASGTVIPESRGTSLFLLEFYRFPSHPDEVQLLLKLRGNLLVPDGSALTLVAESENALCRVRFLPVLGNQSQTILRIEDPKLAMLVHGHISIQTDDVS